MLGTSWKATCLPPPPPVWANDLVGDDGDDDAAAVATKVDVIELSAVTLDDDNVDVKGAASPLWVSEMQTSPTCSGRQVSW